MYNWINCFECFDNRIGDFAFVGDISFFERLASLGYSLSQPTHQLESPVKLNGVISLTRLMFASLKNL